MKSELRNPNYETRIKAKKLQRVAARPQVRLTWRAEIINARGKVTPSDFVIRI
jgi:hypothetical protein